VFGGLAPYDLAINQGPDAMTFSRPFTHISLWAVALFSSVSQAQPLPRWEPAAPAGVARQELYPEVLDGRIYVAGGLLSPNTGYSAHFEAWDAGQARWTRLATLPEARHHIALAGTNGRLWGIGGFSGGFPNWRAESSVFWYEPAADRWHKGPDLTQARAEGVAAAVQGRVYWIGGRVPAFPGASHFNDHEDSTRAEVLDPATGRWSRLPDAPTARNSAASAVIDGRIYVVGGRTAQKQADGTLRQVNVSTLEVFDPASNTWTTRQPMPQARGGLAAATHKGKLYVFGGEQWVPEQKVFADSWVYDPAKDQWQALPPMPTARHGLGAATLNNRIHLVGGGLRVGGNAASDVHEVLVLEGTP
jgi:N-acetylneuraminic acid mutarotase